MTTMLSVIILNYNGEEFVEKCLVSLQKQTFGDFEIIFVDNASHDSSAALVEKMLPELELKDRLQRRSQKDPHLNTKVSKSRMLLSKSTNCANAAKS